MEIYGFHLSTCPFEVASLNDRHTGYPCLENGKGLLQLFRFPATQNFCLGDSTWFKCAFKTNKNSSRILLIKQKPFCQKPLQEATIKFPEFHSQVQSATCCSFQMSWGKRISCDSWFPLKYPDQHKVNRVPTYDVSSNLSNAKYMHLSGWNRPKVPLDERPGRIRRLGVALLSVMNAIRGILSNKARNVRGSPSSHRLHS